MIYGALLSYDIDTETESINTPSWISSECSCTERVCCNVNWM